MFVFVGAGNLFYKNLDILGGLPAGRQVYGTDPGGISTPGFDEGAQARGEIVWKTA